ncbi:L,D-transpeptidase [Dictyobacter arantiisoli]|uniref:L,D-TPase catalytic domain-containing protein n=1 Tax=Dictyobacter arantiisoli TaxID=2014874 RepID=A0A5A5T5R2_9CHLR|nr:L,D-transpeptidase [Dictyobacter arantiisoli]GCF06712.1 hypothetical protein KDI_02760 [Dictyobacter arantiisoli]
MWWLSYPVVGRARLMRCGMVLVVVGVLLATSACAGNPQIRQHTQGNQQRFDQLLLSAYQIGFTADTLQPILQQEQRLRQLRPPTSLLSNQPIDDYYLSLGQKYLQLTSQLQHFMDSNTAHIRLQVQQQLRSAHMQLQQQQSTGLPLDGFTTRLNQLQRQLSLAQALSDFAYVSAGIQDVHLSMQLLPATAVQLSQLKQMVDLFHASRLNSADLTQHYQLDQQRMRTSSSSASIRTLVSQLNAQYQLATVIVAQAIPDVTSARLTELNRHIQTLPGYHIDATPYRTRMAADHRLVTPTMSITAYRHFLQQIDRDIYDVQADALRTLGQRAIDQFHQDLAGWSDSHLYYDDYDNNSYAIDISYQDNNFGSGPQALLNQATSLADLQAATDDANTLYFNHQLMEQDCDDPTSYDQVHAADMRALQHYQLLSGQVIVISLCKQTLRFYQDGNLVRAFIVTTGRTERPSPPGVWSVMNRLSPTVFKSDDAPDSPYWYPNTIIQNAILFHDGGYFIHDSWWRKTYGPGTEFPHADASGDQHDSGNGSHGCVNLPPDQAAWLYNNTSYNTTVIVY